MSPNLFFFLSLLSSLVSFSTSLFAFIGVITYSTFLPYRFYSTEATNKRKNASHNFPLVALTNSSVTHLPSLYCSASFVSSMRYKMKTIKKNKMSAAFFEDIFLSNSFVTSHHRYCIHHLHHLFQQFYNI